jgi:high-affinity Fe2+/Pb2+ permease
MLSLSLFRHPIRTYFFQAAVFSPILGAIIYFFYFELNLKSMIILTNTLIMAFFYILFYKFHTLKALLVSAVGLKH